MEATRGAAAARPIAAAQAAWSAFATAAREKGRGHDARTHLGKLDSLRPCCPRSLPRAPATAAPTKVTGADPTTAAGQQAETAYNLSVVNGQRIETVTSDDETDEIPTFVTYTDTSRTVLRGYSLVGWSYRIRTAQNPNPPFTHAPKLRPPSGWAVLWGDPSITSNPDLPNVVLIASLAVPDGKFPSGGIMGGVGGVCTPLGGACVARSTDGGQSFSIASCFSDTRPINGFLDTCTGFERDEGALLRRLVRCDHALGEHVHGIRRLRRLGSRRRGHLSNERRDVVAGAGLRARQRQDGKRRQHRNRAR